MEPAKGTRAKSLDAVAKGDVIFGLGAGGQEKLLLVYRADRAGFSARHITTQMEFRFGRDGKTRIYADGGQVVVVSTAALPPDQHEVAIGLDSKMGTPRTYPDTKLSEAEIQLLLTYVDHFKSHPLSEE